MRWSMTAANEATTIYGRIFVVQKQLFVLSLLFLNFSYCVVGYGRFAFKK
jgi:hypothetical protein